ncbi:hypothetical protein FBUS_03434 [Fasciolopsis buskii]|uniref:Uncharacterized protein n=1 Tax=Fasciolopsis buskii TaxID=27845 RepID=A0A8E0RNM8_9TREM|nr:hypothetical protein FBUS_03434 [Fasciolopsis buski]
MNPECRKTEQGPTAWQNWSYLVELMTNDHVVQIHVTNETHFRLGNLSHGTCYQLRLGVITSPAQVFVHGCTLMKAPDRQIAIIQDDCIQMFSYANDQYHLSARLEHPFHRQIRSVRIRLPLLWVNLLSGDVYVGRLNEQVCPTDTGLPGRELTIVTTNVTNWKHLVGVEADTIEIDHSTNDVYFIKQTNKWLYRWAPEANGQTKLLNEDSIRGEIVLILQVATEDIRAMDSNVGLAILTRRTTDKDCTMFWLPFNETRNAVKVTRSRGKTLVRIPGQGITKLVTSYANFSEYVFFSWPPMDDGPVVWHGINLTSGNRTLRNLTHHPNTLYRGYVDIQSVFVSFSSFLRISQS